MSDKSLQNMDWLVLMSAVLLIVIGLLNLFSVGHIPAELSETFEGGNMRFFQKQVIWGALGLGVMALAYFIPFRYYEGGAVIFYFTVLIMLIVVLLMGAAKGSSRWIVLGGFQFQPSEVMKVAIIFLLARFLTEKRHDPNHLKILFAATAITLVPFLLVVKQPDLGT
ncbi:MAG: rod shape-determining protein RodA, partial [Deltaproteobacteria bacterium]